MAYQWNKAWEIGYPLVDAQHKMLIHKYNSFIVACASGKGKVELMGAINFLLSYTVEHFSDEEALQIQINYPHYDKHKMQHDTFKMGAEKLASRLEKEGPSARLVVQFNADIGDWLIRHIKTEDARLTSYIKN